MRRPVGALAVLGALLAACTPPGPPDRALHPRTGDPRFLVVTNQALAPLAVGSASGLWITTDVGRTWRAARPSVRGALAIGFTAGRVYVSRGQHYEIRDPSLRTQVVVARRWPFPGTVTGLASDPRHNRMWALARIGNNGQTLRYTNDGGRIWWVLSGHRPLPPSALDRRVVGAGARRARPHLRGLPRGAVRVRRPRLQLPPPDVGPDERPRRRDVDVRRGDGGDRVAGRARVARSRRDVRGQGPVGSPRRRRSARTRR